MNLLDKIKKAGLVGRGGACFPVADKWSAVMNASGEQKFVICNASEGEPGVKKDGHILEKYPERVVDGMRLSMEFLGADKGIIYINNNYFQRFNKKLKNEIRDLAIEVFKKPKGAGYVGGEESSLINAIEGQRIGPRLRPPFPTVKGLWGFPTLVHNIETLYNISLVSTNEFKGERFYTISGDCLWEGVYAFPEDFTIEKVLKETNNYPDFSFFVQVGGDASGEVLNSSQLKKRASGAGLITVHSILKHDSRKLIDKWLSFFAEESCGKCTPCREGTYRLKEIFDSPNPDWALFSEVLQNLSESAFCGLGCAVPIPIGSYIKNVLPLIKNNNLKISPTESKIICECSW
jgi:NADH:ubiquinone oxidoreductase subunit F (NADH-binding)